MTEFAGLPPADRWRALDDQLPAIIEAHMGTGSIPEDEEIPLAELAERHDATVRKIRTQLAELGAPAYRIGKEWMVRRKTYARALALAETRSKA